MIDKNLLENMGNEVQNLAKKRPQCIYFSVTFLSFYFILFYFFCLEGLAYFVFLKHPF